MIAKIIAILSGFIIAVISKMGYMGIVLLMAIESACIPLPSEIIMPFSGYLVSRGEMNLWWVGVAGAVDVRPHVADPGHGEVSRVRTLAHDALLVGRHLVGDVAMEEYLAGHHPDALVAGDPAVGTADPQHARRLLLGESLEKPGIILVNLCRPGPVVGHHPGEHIVFRIGHVC